ncbi:MAG: glycosyltransferase family 2 protein [Phycisphaerales bacterium]|nr:glycosyltransferase family 2 protein [Phycisphaerales bacterium]
MQSIQTTILKATINIGQVPVFIIAPSQYIGSLFAFLLSENLDVSRQYARIFEPITHQNNYFTNPRVAHSLASAQDAQYRNANEDFLKIKLQLEEHKDNGKLWGLLCNYQQFFQLTLSSISPKAYSIFIYEESDGLLSPYYEKMLAFKSEHQGLVCLINAKMLVHNAKNIVPLLPFTFKSALKFDFIPEPEDEGLENEMTAQNFVSKTLNDALMQNDFLSETKSLFVGDRFCVIIQYMSLAYRESLITQLRSIQNSWLCLPEINLICLPKDEEELRSIVAELQLTDVPINYSVGNNLVSQLNQIATSTEKEYVFFNNLKLQINISSTFKFLEGKNECADLIFYKASLEEAMIGSSMNIVDIIASHDIEHGLICRRSVYNSIFGFDAALESSVFLWDFVIRAAENALTSISSFAAPIAQKHLDNNLIDNKIEHILHKEAYHQVISKHKVIFENHLEALMQLLSSRHHLPQQEMTRLYQKMGNIQNLLQHSKTELKAITDLSRTLQHRINVLENKWHYKLGKKISRLKKIFFKKNTKGSGRLKKILRFFIFTFSKPGITLMRKIAKRAFKKVYLIAEDRPVRIIYLDEKRQGNHIDTYDDWIKIRQNKEAITTLFQKQKQQFKTIPKISIVMPVYNPPLKYLKEAIESVLAQDYQNWELCIADDCSPNEKVQKLLKTYSLKDNRIKVHFRIENGHISASSNSALAMASGDFVLFMDHDDLLSLDCLFEVVKHINQYPEQDIIYSDEDKIAENNIHSMPHFKPDWAPHSLLSRNYFGHVVVIRKTILDDIGGFRIGFEGSQDYDLILRATERSKGIGHIPKVLYHWRIHEMSAAQSEEVKPYAYIAAKKALEEALERRGTPGTISYLSGLRGYRVYYDLQTSAMVSIIIPTKDHVQLLKNTIDSIISLTSYKNYEIIVLNNNSITAEFDELVAQYDHQYPNLFRCIEAKFPFNFSKLMNIGVNASKGEYILLLNNDVEVIQADWLSTMLSYAQLQHTGAVGVKLLYPDDLIQHAGVIVGLGGVAGHVFVNAFKDEPGYFNYIQSVNNFSAVTAACLMVKKSLYQEVQGMNEGLEVEYNDVDFCLRLIEAGYYNVYLPQVELYHYESATRGHPHQSRESWERHLREIDIFKSLWQKYIDRDPFYNPNLNIGVHDFSLNFAAPLHVTD